MFTYWLTYQNKSQKIRSKTIPTKQEVAVRFVEFALANGPQDMQEVLLWAKENCLTYQYIHHASHVLRVIKKGQGWGPAKSSLWKLPRTRA